MSEEQRTDVLDVLYSMLESDRVFYNTMRLMGEGRERMIAQHTAMNSAVLVLISRFMSGNSIHLTMPINLPANWSEPITVTPTQEQITAGTEDVELEDETCAICQDELAQGTRLRNCNHSFHTGCIQQWFSHSCYCPVCRNDIRTAPTN
jgi:hypothetical protein